MEPIADGNQNSIKWNILRISFNIFYLLEKTKLTRSFRVSGSYNQECNNLYCRIRVVMEVDGQISDISDVFAY